MQLFTRRRLFWLPSVFQGHKIYLLLAGDNFSGLYFIIPKDFSHPPVTLVVYSGLHAGGRWGSSVFARSGNVVISRKKRRLFLARRSYFWQQVIFCVCCVAPHSTRAAWWGRMGCWDGAQPGTTRPSGHRVNIAPQIHLWAGFLSSSSVFISSDSTPVPSPARHLCAPRCPVICRHSEGFFCPKWASADAAGTWVDSNLVKFNVVACYLNIYRAAES